QRSQPTAQNGPAVAAYGQDVPLPAGVTKEVTLWAPVEMNMGGAVRLTAGGRLLAERAIEFKGVRMPGWPLVGVLAESPTVARDLGQIDLPLQQGLRAPLSVARLQVGDIPSEAERLNGLKALVVQGTVPAGLTGEQRRAVEAWIADGGHLVISGGPDAARAAGVLPPGSLPVTFAGAEAAADLAPLARLGAGSAGAAGGQNRAPAATLPPGPAAVFQPAGGAVLAGTPERPLAWRLNLGARRRCSPPTSGSSR